MDIDNDFLKRRFHISYLRPYQELAINYIMDSACGRASGKILCILPTGGGKSLCFMYPIAKLGRRAVLIYPLLSLMNDQGKRFDEAGIPYETIRGGLERTERARRLRHIKEDKAVSVITNIESLIVMDGKGELDILSKDTLMVVIDEAHTVPEWGESFREAYMKTGEIIRKIRPSLILAFTATADSRICRGIEKYIFSGAIPYTVHASADRENIFYHGVRSLSKVHDAAKILSGPSSRPAVIFCRSRKLTETIAKKLGTQFDIRYYHADLPKEEKEEKERWFHTSRDGVLAATSAYGMGVDKKDIRTVIHMSLPDDAASFLQEAGRGGRDGGRMDSYVLYHNEEQSPISHVFRSGKCIRTALLSAMGEERESTMCLACSSCVPDGYRRSGEAEILRYVAWHPFTKPGYAAAALTSRHIFLKSRRLCSWSEREAEEAIRRLISENAVIRIAGRIVKRRNGSGKRMADNS